MDRERLNDTLETLRLLADGFMGHEPSFQVFARAEHALRVLLDKGSVSMMEKLERYAKDPNHAE